ncbi:MAG: hypothetical protein Q7T19_02270 [Caulobacter sp.]|nr:hypothetical protein [Caulobacter sp.]
MPRVSTAFFTIAALCGLAGMVWGSQMGASGDHSLHPAHAHLNLVGWVTLSIMGGFYALPGGPKAGVLSWVNLALSSVGAVLMAALLPQVLMQKMSGQIMIAAEVPTILGMICFLISVISSWRRPVA